MTIPLNSLSILATDEGSDVVRVLFFVFVVLMWIIGVIVKKAAEKRAQQQTDERHMQIVEFRQTSSGSDDDDWQIVAEPPKPRQAPVPVPVSVPGKRQKLSNHHLAASRVVSKELRQTTSLKTPPRDVAADSPHRILVNLTSSDSARNAMIFHEIFALPRALRTEPQRWD